MNTYYQDTAQRITGEVMKIANENVNKGSQKHFFEFFRFDDKGIWPANQFDSKSIEGKYLAWKPCHEFDRASGLNRPTAPGLPFPFTGRHLAAFMLRGVGALIADAFVDWEDGPIPEPLAELTEDWDRSAIEDAFDAYRAAERVVGAYDTTYSEKIQELENQYGQWPDDTQARQRIKQAHLDAENYEADRRKQLVNQLLAVSQVTPDDPHIAGHAPTAPAQTAEAPAPVVAGDDRAPKQKNKSATTLRFDAKVIELMGKFWDERTPGTEPNKSDLCKRVYQEILRTNVRGVRQTTESMVRDAAKPWKRPLVLPAFVPDSKFNDKRHPFKGDK